MPFRPHAFLILLFLVAASFRADAAEFLSPGESLAVGESIVSLDGRFALTLETSGNLELRYLQQLIWETGTSGSGATLASFDGDGNFVLYAESAGGDPTTITLEAENCQFSRARVKPLGDASAGEYIDFRSNGNMNCPYNAIGGTHELAFRIRIPGGATRRMGVFVNGTKIGIAAASSTSWSTSTYPGITLADGINAIEIRDTEGSRELDVDKLDVTSAGSGGGTVAVWETFTGNLGATQLIIQDDGNLVIYAGTTPLWASGTCCYEPEPPMGDGLSSTGFWGPVQDWRLIAIHSVLTPDGKILTYGTDEQGAQGGQFIYDVWDPVTGVHETLPNTVGTDIFCSAPIIIPETGEIILAGGDTRTPANAGVDDVNIFDPTDNSLTATYAMSYARWYPTITTLPNGELLIHGGRNGDFQPTRTPEIFSVGDGWRALFGATNDSIINNTFGQWWYPRNFVAPDGRVFGVTGQQMYYLDTDGGGSTELAGRLENGPTFYTSTAVMYDTGKILQTGGPIDRLGDGSASTNRAVVIDINGAAPVVREIDPMQFPRQWLDSTLLPNGEVLITGGSDIVNELEGTAETAEIWSPVTETWRSVAAAELPRLYHSTAILLPDATVLIAGGGAPGPLRNTNAEIYYPPYLYNEFDEFAIRPVVTGGTEFPAYGDTLSFDTTSTIARVTMLKTGSVTHSFNMDQRFLELDFAQDGTTLTATLPDSANLATPGSYMLFFFDDAGVPSEAPILTLRPEEGNGGGGDPTPNKLVRYSATGQQGTMSQIVDLEANTDYILSVKTSAADGTAGRSVFDTQDRWDDICQWTTPAGGWELRSCTFNSGAFTDVRLRMFATPTFDGEAFWDDVVLTEVGSSVNLVTNGDFEAGDTGWAIPNDNFEIIDENGGTDPGPDPDPEPDPEPEPADNTGAMRYQGAGIQGTVNQTISLSPNTNYRISVDLKTAAGSSGRSVFDTNDRFDAGCQWTTPAGEWTPRVCTFNSGAFSDVRIRLFATGTFNGTAYWDNIVITEEGSATNLITNGDFENGTAGWNVPNGAFTVSGEDLPQ